MSDRLHTKIGAVVLKNPLIAAAAEHLIDAEGVRRALAPARLRSSSSRPTNSQAAKDQLQRAEYMVLDDAWRPVRWGPRRPPPPPSPAARASRHNRSTLGWSRPCARSRSRACDAYAVASLILAELEPATAMARKIEQAGVRVLELNIGTPYASQARGVVSTELDPARVHTIVAAVRAAVGIPLWVKLTGQSEHVPALARAAFDAGADSVVMAGRLLGMIPDVETFAPMLGTTLGVGGFWNLPLTCHWLALTRAEIGRDQPLIGINGAQSGLDIARMMLAGASAVAMASPVMLRGFDVLTQALADLDDYLARKNIAAAELVGRAADGRKTFAEMPIRADNWRNYVPA